MNNDDRATCAALSGLLRASRTLAACGFALTVIAAAILALRPGPLSQVAAMAASLVIVLGAPERYLAFRLQFDQTLFSELAHGGIDSLGGLDGALHRLGLRRAGAQARDLADRVRGARALMRRHAIVVGCQTALFLFTLFAVDLA